MRGLKLSATAIFMRAAIVALLVSAWIETGLTTRNPYQTIVALLVSAWIETIYGSKISVGSNGRTPRECVD